MKINIFVFLLAFMIGNAFASGSCIDNEWHDVSKYLQPYCDVEITHNADGNVTKPFVCEVQAYCDTTYCPFFQIGAIEHYKISPYNERAVVIDNKGLSQFFYVPSLNLGTSIYAEYYFSDDHCQDNGSGGCLHSGWLYHYKCHYVNS